MPPRTWVWGLLSAALVLGLASCGRGTEDTAANHPVVVPVNPGSGLTGSFPSGTGTSASMGAAPASESGAGSPAGHR